MKKLKDGRNTGPPVSKAGAGSLRPASFSSLADCSVGKVATTYFLGLRHPAITASGTNLARRRGSPSKTEVGPRGRKRAGPAGSSAYSVHVGRRMAAHRSGPLKHQNKPHKGWRHHGGASAQRDSKGEWTEEEEGLLSR